MATVDWGLARQVAGMVQGTPKQPDAPLAGDPAQTALDAVGPISDYTGLVPQAPIAPAESVDRAQWTAANLDTMSTLIDPLAGRIGDGLGPLAGIARAVGGAVIGAEVGALAGWLGSRVLGQYDIQLLDPPDGVVRAPRLLLVVPNLRNAARELDVEEARLVRWVTVHEVTHAVQFTGVPWLRDHIGGLVRGLLDGLEVRVDSGKLISLPSRDELRDLAAAVRKGDLMGLTTLTGQGGADMRERLEAIQATMALVEGHAELVMDAVGEQMLGDLADMRRAMDRRRADRPALVAWLERVLGFELKLRQYTQGRAFCDAVIERSDVATLHRAFADPAHLPTLAELADADAWLARVAA